MMILFENTQIKLFKRLSAWIKLKVFLPLYFLLAYEIQLENCLTFDLIEKVRKFFCYKDKFSKKLFTEIKPANVSIESSKHKLMKLLSKSKQNLKSIILLLLKILHIK